MASLGDCYVTYSIICNTAQLHRTATACHCLHPCSEHHGNCHSSSSSSSSSSSAVPPSTVGMSAKAVDLAHARSRATAAHGKPADAAAA